MTYPLFKQQAELFLRRQGEAARRFPWYEPRAYAEWLVQSYFYVCHSTRLLSAAAARLGVDEDKLHLRFLAHMGEERSHEKLAVSDLKHLGFGLNDFAELPETAAFYQSQYYWIEHVNPKALFGYILSLEGLAAAHGKAIHEEVLKHHGAKAALFWKVHAEDDHDHVRKLYEQLESFSAHELEAVAKNFMQSSQLYVGLLAAIRERALKAARSETVFPRAA